MSSNLSSEKATCILGVVSPRRLQDHSSVQCVWPMEEGNLDCRRSCREPSSTQRVSAGVSVDG